MAALQGAHNLANRGLQLGREIIERLLRQAPENATLQNDLAQFDSEIDVLPFAQGKLAPGHGNRKSRRAAKSHRSQSSFKNRRF